MRKPVLLIFINAMILVFVFVLLAQSLLIASRRARAESVRGVVEVQRHGQGEFRALASGQSVAVGDVVRTGRDGRVEFTWADKTRWKLTPGTRLTIDKATTNMANNSETSRFRLESGQIFVRLVKPVKEGSSFEIRTPRARAWALGTIFSIAVTSDGATCVETFAGNVKLESAGRQFHVGAGQAATTGRPRAPSLIKARCSRGAFLAQPDLVRPALVARLQPLKRDVVLIRGATEAGDTLEINGQRALVLANGGFARRFTLAPGHNQWRIVATDKHGAVSTVCRALNYNVASDAKSASPCRSK